MENPTFLSDVSVVLPCYNEEKSIQDTIKFLQDLGIINILIVNDGSLDNTREKAIEKNATVINNSYNYGYGTSLITGLYSVNTKYVFISNKFRFDRKSFFDFIKFGINGNHSLLLSEKQYEPIYDILIPNIAPALKKKYNVLIPEPSLDCAFIGTPLLEKIKDDTLGKEHIILELIRVASNNNLKIGTYDLKSDSNFNKIKSIKYLLFMRHYLCSYLKIAFPDSRIQNIKDQVIVAVIVYAVLRVFEYSISTLPDVINQSSAFLGP